MLYFISRLRYFGCLAALQILFSQTAPAPVAPSQSSPTPAPQTNRLSITAQDVEAKDLIKRQLARIGNLMLSVGPPTEASPSRTLKLNLDPDRDKNLVANYRFPGQSALHPLAEKGVSLAVPLPANVDMVLVTLTWCNGNCPQTAPELPYVCPNSQQETGHSNPVTCSSQVVFFLNDANLVGTVGDQDVLLPGIIITPGGLQISEALIAASRSGKSATFVINGTPVSDLFGRNRGPAEGDFVLGGRSYAVDSVFGWQSVRRFHIERYPFTDSCRLYLDTEVEFIDVDRPAISNAALLKDNGIAVSPSKVFDTFTLRQMLASTATQLAGISGFNQAGIFGAVGNLQGITRDVSYVSAQVTTVPTPTVSSTAVNGGTGSNTNTSSLALATGATNSGTILSCPPGTLPSVGTSGVQACAPIASTILGTAATGLGIGGGVSLQNNSQNTSGLTLNTGNTGVQTTNQQNTVTTSSGGQAGTVAPVYPSTAFAPPTNVGVAASDILAEQVQLNSQITTLRLLLQGAVSDQYLVKQGRAVATRQQTTVGFNISLNPPQRYRHAVAEVKVWIDPPDGDDAPQVMNLLPADKTYNVAKITSRQNAFGAGTVIDLVNAGISTGHSKDRLYLAKDTDTVALQFTKDKPGNPHGADLVARSAPEHIRDAVRYATMWQSIANACADDPVSTDNATVFGWQFRPVLGADYVLPGQRLVFAQLALPSGLGEQFAPAVHIQTRWREYDPKGGVVGPVYAGSCSISEDPNPITVISPLRVHEVNVDDMGAGVLKVSAAGDFFASGFSVLSGPNTIPPTTFDGRNLQFFANAHDLLLSNDLKLIGEDGQITRLGMESRGSPDLCWISSADMRATPQPDGNSLVEMRIASGSRYSLNPDKEPHPLVLIGPQVYGLHETPFMQLPDDGCAPDVFAGGIRCTYHFLASTDVLRTSQTFTVADLAWKEFRRTGRIDMGPTFSSLAILGSKPADYTKADCGGYPPAPPAACVQFSPLLFSLTGSQFDKFQDPASWNCQGIGCLEVYWGMDPFPLSIDNFHVASKTAAALQWSHLPTPGFTYAFKSLRFIWHATESQAVEWDLSIPSDTKPSITASAILNVSDSAQITFSSVELSAQPTLVTFDNNALPAGTFTYDTAKKTMTVLITSSMTAKPGHKELTATDPAPVVAPAKPKTIQLPFDVTKR